MASSVEGAQVDFHLLSEDTRYLPSFVFGSWTNFLSPGLFEHEQRTKGDARRSHISQNIPIPKNFWGDIFQKRIRIQKSVI